jgi:hypothetical protein
MKRDVVAAPAFESLCSFLETEVTSMFIKFSWLASVRSRRVDL